MHAVKTLETTNFHQLTFWADGKTYSEKNLCYQLVNQINWFKGYPLPDLRGGEKGYVYGLRVEKVKGKGFCESPQNGSRALEMTSHEICLWAKAATSRNHSLFQGFFYRKFHFSEIARDQACFFWLYPFCGSCSRKGLAQLILNKEIRIRYAVIQHIPYLFFSSKMKI